MKAYVIVIIIVVVVLVVVAIALTIWYLDRKAITQKACKNRQCGKDKTGLINCGTCSGNQKCQNGLCVNPSCSSDSDCASGQSCVNQQCETKCTSDTNCPSGQKCIDQICKTGPTPGICKVSTDCPNLEVCVNSACTCPSGYQVDNNVCHISSLTLHDCKGVLNLSDGNYCVAMTYLTSSSANVQTLDGKNSATIDLTTIIQEDSKNGTYYLITVGNSKTVNNAVILYVTRDGQVIPVTATYSGGSFSNWQILNDDKFNVTPSSLDINSLMGSLINPVIKPFYVS